MLVSTFELLVKSQLQQGSTDPLSRTVVQGYFLTISNLNFFPVTLSLVFTGVPPIGPETLTFFDAVGGMNIMGNLVQDTNPPFKSRIQLRIGANDTGLFLLQPDIISNNQQLLTDADFEVRGFVEIFVSSLSGHSSADLLVTPEQRGTFFRDLTAQDALLDQIAYGVPTAHGGSLFKLSNS